MKNQIDLLMKDKAIDAILISGAGDHNPAMVYLRVAAILMQM